ncbi:hypothetical protein FHR83_008703 [Actinoplanes campanulatus]|uniref:Uncharacterized protein n=1 Tax=Actinoplanes campanulatus TaxID=113559 RepID=A0A7W5FJT0_9ACTN|nr:hypothetical protein [Actinoplanes campanulatus]MBB3100976.1 hypothetical protein [Actinoplanes campanulatus]GGN49069.1 hypothetical protein GCM10010109_86690 [Actinoplanes campanulatus]GID41794.1 hypothetical protein Aca09nite_83000 [Actinoplanes campanulatus]
MQVVLTLGRDEIRRLAAVLCEVGVAMFRAEFFIRTGGSQPNIEAIAEQLVSVADGKPAEFEVPVLLGIENEENPRRPRPIPSAG